MNFKRGMFMTSKKSKKDNNKSQNFGQQFDDENVVNFDDDNSDEGGEDALGLDYPSRRELEDKLTALEKETNEYKDKALRAQAILDNVNRRAERDVEKAHKYGTEKLLLEILPVLDSLNRGLEGKEPKESQAKSMYDGIKLTSGMLVKVLKKFGIQAINPKVGDPFDPAIHEAMSTVPATDQKAHTVMRVLQKGYQLNDRVIRAAMVIVAA